MWEIGGAGSSRGQWQQDISLLLFLGVCKEYFTIIHSFLYPVIHCLSAHEASPMLYLMPGGVKDAQTDTVSRCSQSNGDDRGKQHRLTELVISTLPSASKESIKTES